MRRALKWVGFSLGGIVLIAAIAFLVMYGIGRARLNQTYSVEAEEVPIEDDEATLARGQHLVEAIAACGECHGEGLGGTVMVEDPALGTIVAANLTGGEGGVAARYDDQDWVRAIRHGVDPDGKPLLVMPAQDFSNLSAQDLGAVIAYVKTLPPVDNEPPSTGLGPMAHVLLTMGQLDDMLPAEYVDHDTPLPAAPPKGATEAYGEYLIGVATCQGCHGAELAGGQAGPGEPIGPNLTPAGDLSDWTQEDFFRLIRTGQTPAGRQINDFMPWRYYRNMTDVELEAIWLYLQSLEPMETPPDLGNG